MSFQVLSANDYRWRSLIDELPADRRDIHFRPELSQIYSDAYGWDAHLAVYEESDQFIIQPFVVQGNNDIWNAFNFGGPVANNETLNYCNGFRREFTDWKTKRGITVEHCVLNPLLAKHQLAVIDNYVELTSNKDVVYADLRGDFQLRSTHRQLVAKAKNHGVAVVQAHLGISSCKMFDAMYHETMHRLGAAEHWLHPYGFFYINYSLLGPRMTLFMAYVGVKPEAGAILIHDYDTCYYHYAASFANYRDLGVNHAMVLTTMKWAKEQGFTWFHLGGGVKPNDGLALFKGGFSKLRAPVYSYEIHQHA